MTRSRYKSLEGARAEKPQRGGIAAAAGAIGKAFSIGNKLSFRPDKFNSGNLLVSRNSSFW